MSATQSAHWRTRIIYQASHGMEKIDKAVALYFAVIITLLRWDRTLWSHHKTSPRFELIPTADAGDNSHKKLLCALRLQHNTLYISGDQAMINFAVGLVAWHHTNTAAIRHHRANRRYRYEILHSSWVSHTFLLEPYSRLLHELRDDCWGTAR